MNPDFCPDCGVTFTPGHFDRCRASGIAVPPPKVIIFTFAGRRPNVELQLPLFRDIVEHDAGVEIHMWNLARDPEDARWLRKLDTGHPRIVVVNDYYGDGIKPWDRFADVYKRYTDPYFTDYLFVKLDDDVVFIETQRRDQFLANVDTCREHVISAKIINNGASTRLEHDLWAAFKRLRIRLLDVHKSRRYCEQQHTFFLDHWQELVGRPPVLVPTDDWLSINLIGYDYAMGRRIVDLLGTAPPRKIAGRTFNPARDSVGDEGAVNMLPRLIMMGFEAAHLYFGPQAERMTVADLDEIRRGYKRIGEAYLA